MRPSHRGMEKRPELSGALFFVLRVLGKNLAPKDQVIGRKVCQVGEDGRQTAGLYAEPGGQRCLERVREKEN